MYLYIIFIWCPVTITLNCSLGVAVPSSLDLLNTHGKKYATNASSIVKLTVTKQFETLVLFEVCATELLYYGVV